MKSEKQAYSVPIQYRNLFALEDPDIGNGEFRLRDFKFLLRSFGISKNNFIARVPEKWVSLLKEKVRVLPDGPRKTNFLDILNNKSPDSLRKKLLSAPRVAHSYDEKQSFVKNLIRLQEEHKVFEAVFINREEGEKDKQEDNNRLYSISEVLDNDTLRKQLKLEGNASVWIKPEPDHFAIVCEPLFELSKEVYIQDPYLNPFSEIGHDRIFEAIYKKMAACQVDTLKVIFNRSELTKKNVDEEKVDTYFDNIRQKVDRNIRVEKRILDYAALKLDSNDGQVVHDVSHKRYIYSIYGGIEFDKGIQETGRKNETIVNFFPSENFHEFKKAYDTIFSMD